MVEILVAATLSIAVAIALAALIITVSRMNHSVLYQQQSLRQAKTAIERINIEIRRATLPVRVVNPAGLPALQGNAIQFSRLGEPPYQHSIRIVSEDGDLMTPWDNALVYTPAGGDDEQIARWVTPIEKNGAFRYSGATAPLTVWMRAGDPVDEDLNDASARSGPGLQGVEINITVAPRN
ncbi:hypothetical protein HQ520_18390 [bacterium]|nr:hypothetical protein [bacterium]